MSQKNGRILVVDDDQTNRMLLELGLQRQGHRVLTAGNGRQALNLLHAQPVDLVLLDIVMPEVNGLQVLARMKQEPALVDIPVVVISAVDQMKSIVKCIEMGAEDYLPKPVDPVLLRARINAGLQKKRFRDQEVEYLQQVSLISDAAAALESQRFVPDSLDGVAVRSDALGTLARVFRRMAAEVAAREQQLARDNQVKAAFIDVISHELRTPFASATMSVELLQRYVQHQMFAEAAAQIEQLAGELAQGRQLIETILSFAGQVGKELKLQLRVSDVDAIVREAMAPLHPMAESRGVQLLYEPSSSLPPVQADRRRLGEAIHHLVHNGIKFTPAGGRVEIHCRQQESDVLVQVRDSGAGIPTEKLAQIWEPFSQESDRVRRGMEGLGLGLPLVKAIIEAHRGQVGAASEPGSGSTFYFTLPLPGW